MLNKWFKAMDKKFAIFDMDGTLIDSMGIWRNLGREYLKSKGITEGIEAAIEEIAPLAMSESAALFVERFGLKGDANSVADEMNQLIDEHYRSDIPLKNGCRQLLDALRASGVQMCVASATDERLMSACLKRLGVWDYFTFVLSCETLHTNKREPTIYLEAARRFQAIPSEIAVYEDALYAVETAKAAGFHVISVYDSEQERYWRKICSLADEIIVFS